MYSGNYWWRYKNECRLFGSEIKDILVSVQAIDKTTGNVLTIPADQINFDYRNNNLSEDLIFKCFI